jgi:hypothetical protein
MPPGGPVGRPKTLPAVDSDAYEVDSDALAGGAQLLARVGAAALPPQPFRVQQVGAGELGTHAGAPGRQWPARR